MPSAVSWFDLIAGVRGFPSGIRQAVVSGGLAGADIAVPGIKQGDLLLSVATPPGAISQLTLPWVAQKAVATEADCPGLLATDSVVQCFRDQTQVSTVTHIAGGVAGAHAITSIVNLFMTLKDVLQRVIHKTAAAADVDLSSEFTVSGDAEIDNTAGTDTTGDILEVHVHQTLPKADVTARIDSIAANIITFLSANDIRPNIGSADRAGGIGGVAVGDGRIPNTGTLVVSRGVGGGFTDYTSEFADVDNTIGAGVIRNDAAGSNLTGQTLLVTWVDLTG